MYIYIYIYVYLDRGIGNWDMPKKHGFDGYRFDGHSLVHKGHVSEHPRIVSVYSARSFKGISHQVKPWYPFIPGFHLHLQLGLVCSICPWNHIQIVRVLSQALAQMSIIWPKKSRALATGFNHQDSISVCVSVSNPVDQG